jgi:PAS domain S-box-containing protein
MTTHSDSIDRFEADLVIAAMDAAAVGFCVIDESNYMVMLNRVWLDLFGFDGKADYPNMLGAPVSQTYAHISITESIEAVTSGKVAEDLVIAGSRRKLLMVSGKTMNFRGENQFRVLSATDVTRLKTAEAQLDLLQRQVAAINSGVVITDPSLQDNPIIFANSAFEEMSGYVRSEIVGRNCRFLQGIDRDQIAVRDMRDAIGRNESFYAVLRNYRKDGSLFLNELYISPVFDAEGKLTNYIGVQNDITHRSSRISH